MQKLLLIDDDEKLGTLLSDYFRRFEFDLSVAHDGTTGLEKLAAESPLLVILDVMLPGRDGFEVCREIRQSSDIPVVMLTARGDVTDRVVGLELGADDYLPKPFEPRELVARIQTVLRRMKPRASDGPFVFDGLTIDTKRHVATLDGEPMALTTMEFALLELFARNAGETLSRDRILNELRGIDAELFTRAVDNLVSRLRQKLADTAKQPRFIRTVWGSGYAFVASRPESQ